MGLEIVLLVLIGAALVFAPLVLSGLAFAAGRRVGDLERRLTRLESAVRALSASTPTPTTPPPRPTPAAVAEPIVFLEPSAVEGPSPPIPVATPEAPARAFAMASGPRPPAPVPAPARPAPFDLEWFIGRRALGWAAVLSIIFAGGFFLKYAIENRWIGPLGRVALAAVVGGALVLGGARSRRKGWWIFAQMLDSAGVVLFYLAAYAAFGFYHLLPQAHAAVFLVLIVVGSAALAVAADAQGLAVMAILGGGLTPLLLASETDQYISFFLYLFALALGGGLMATGRDWPPVSTLALLVCQGLFWLWDSENYHPEKRPWTLGLQAALFALFLGQQWATRALWRRESGSVELVRWLLVAGLFFVAVYVLMEPDFAAWRGVFAVGLAALYVLLARLQLDEDDFDEPLFLTTLAVAVGLVAVAIPIEAGARWIALGWAAEASALYRLGRRVDRPTLRLLAVGLAALALGRLVFIDLPDHPRSPDFFPVLNTFALPALGVVACLMWAVARPRRGPKDGLTAPEAEAAGVVEIGGVLLVWLILSIDPYECVRALGRSVGGDPSTWGRRGQMALSMLWGVYAGVVLALGFALRRPRLRWTALGLFGLLVGKVFLVDLQDLGELERILAFLVAAVVLGAAAWIYQKLRPEPAASASAPVEREVPHVSR